MHCSIPTLNNALVLMIQGDLTPSNLERRASLLGILNTIPSLRRIIYKAKMTARPVTHAIKKKGELGIVKHKS